MVRQILQEGSLADQREGTYALHCRSQQGFGLIQSLRVPQEAYGGLRPRIPDTVEGLGDLAQPCDVPPELVDDRLRIGTRLVGFEEGPQPSPGVTVPLESLHRLPEQPPPRGLLSLHLRGHCLAQLLHERAELVQELLSGYGALTRRFSLMKARHGLDFLDRDLPALELLDRQHLVQGARELTDALEAVFGQRLGHPGLEGLITLLRLLPEDRDLGFVLRNPDVDDQASGKPCDQTLVETVDLRGWAIAGQDDLAAGRAELVKEAQEHLLSFLLSGEELHVVEEQDVKALVLLPHLVMGTLMDGPRQLVKKDLNGQVDHAVLRVDLGGVMGYTAENVALAETRTGIDEQWIVRCPGSVGCPPRCCRREPIRRAHHEAVEGEPRIQIRRYHRLIPASLIVPLPIVPTRRTSSSLLGAVPRSEASPH